MAEGSLLEAEYEEDSQMKKIELSKEIDISNDI